MAIRYWHTTEELSAVIDPQHSSNRERGDIKILCLKYRTNGVSKM